MSFICIAKEGNTYKYINTDSLQCFFSVDKLDSSFFEKSYLKLVKDSRKLGIRNKKIYTVVAEILANSYDEVIGYLVSDNQGNLDVLCDSQLSKFVKEQIVTNFYNSQIGNKIYCRRKSGVVLDKIRDNVIKSHLGVSVEDFLLHDDMSLEALNFCMKNNGFKLGFKQSFKYDVFGKVTNDNIFLIYYNKHGDILYFYYTPKSNLRYFGNHLVLLRHVNSNKYQNYLSKNSYIGGSSSPFGDIDDSDIVLFEYSNLHVFLRALKGANYFSTSVIPLGFTCKKEEDVKRSSALFAMYYLKINPEERNLIESLLKSLNINNSVIERELRLIGEFTVSMSHYSEYDKGLQRLFSNMEKYYKYACENCMDEIKDALKKENILNRGTIKGKISEFMESVKKIK